MGREVHLVTMAKLATMGWMAPRGPVEHRDPLEILAMEDPLDPP